MKKLSLLFAFAIAFGMVLRAQNYLQLNIEDLPFGYQLSCCLDEYDSIIFHGQQEWNCSFDEDWLLTYYPSEEQVLVVGDHATIIPTSGVTRVKVFHGGCSYKLCWEGDVEFKTFSAPEPWSQSYVWKRTGESKTLSAPQGQGNDLYYEWSTGSHQQSISVQNPGTYWVRVYNDCGEISDTIQVRDNVELFRATTELSTNLNQVTWQVTTAQAEYISEVKVYRNNQLVGTVPYTDGVFTDDIGSYHTNWRYHLMGVSANGQSSIKSYWKQTIHLDHVQGSNGTDILQWTPYEEEKNSNTVSAYGIYDVVNGVTNHIIDVGHFTNVYTYNPDEFQGYGVVAAVFGGKDLEDLAFSNHTEEVLAVGEMAEVFKVYPNPAQGRFTVEGTGILTISNLLGQEVLHQEINGRKTVENLNSGVYIVRISGGFPQKIVIE